MFLNLSNIKKSVTAISYIPMAFENLYLNKKLSVTNELGKENITLTKVRPKVLFFDVNEMLFKFNQNGNKRG